MTTTLAPVSGFVECASDGAAHDAKIGPEGHLLASVGYSDTPGGALQKLRRHEQQLRAGVSVLAQRGHSGFANAFLLKLDLARLGLFHVELCSGAMLSIETRDAADDVSRLRWHFDRNPTNAKSALRDATRMIESLQEFVAGVLSTHPELR